VASEGTKRKFINCLMKQSNYISPKKHSKCEWKPIKASTIVAIYFLIKLSEKQTEVSHLK